MLYELDVFQAPIFSGSRSCTVRKRGVLDLDLVELRDSFECADCRAWIFVGMVR